MTTVAAAILIVTANAAGRSPLTDNAVRDFARIIQAEADRFEIEPLILVALVEKESDWRASAVNATTGATGLLQIVASPEVLAGGWNQYLAQLQDPRVNLFLGVRRLARFRDLCGGNIWRAVDAFNGRGCKRRTLSPFALDVKARWQRLTGVTVVAETKGGR